MDKSPEEKPKKRKRSSSSSSGSDSEKEKRKRKKQYKKDKRKIKKKMKKLKKKLKRKEKEVIKDAEEQLEVIEDNKSDQEDKTEVRSMAPMTKEEWEKRQSVVRRVLDESTGRYRLIKGDGEVIEEIVSRDRHKEINKQATKGDGNYFQSFFKK
ncbi:GSCOCG00009694001-RA-CDS [Cotesia congregata]|uniref:ADP-ribosylation factor-like protein 6-interacting protein 4 n=2 Tax=Cotesia TaxID=32390 RepID=A0A8J2EGI0_COTCN|nr:ADP-ribosylation factor-like protein 6-interacting protein 4 [Cotesia glomerata]XP_044582462.1 ADP-ribosylation factor-like protein 6-interacting protein 4 [Cotesia glomerata]KAH0554644.1 hypothetical protein KQX54_012069 [Cotesia glomerata]CAD6202643.1 GSCOCG00009694001-RA-CDS [Cotesia congregata]CAG5074948.1 Similar to ARL6IP4: ADP-ribosylation factor-like protein 6-interacting protein 4 (Gallus gallus) [Cotesia congregata]